MIEVLIAVVMKVVIFWNTAPRSLYINRRFGGTYSALPPIERSFLSRLIFDPEDGVVTFL
jgi:hypothetical protein